MLKNCRLSLVSKYEKESNTTTIFAAREDHRLRWIHGESREENGKTSSERENVKNTVKPYGRPNNKLRLFAPGGAGRKNRCAVSAPQRKALYAYRLMSIDHAIEAIEKFQGASLTQSLSAMEDAIVGADLKESQAFCEQRDIDHQFLESALAIKNVAGQINVIIHASGILHSLASLLEEGEIVESVSLGAGNTGRKFDLETNLRIAEFKFIDWKGGAESIRQNGIFKDFFELAEFDTLKKKCLYVVGTTLPLKFLNGGRALTSVLSKQPVMLARIQEKYGGEIKVVRQYFDMYKDSVGVYDVRHHIGRSI